MMEEYRVKSRVVGVDIGSQRTTYALVDVRGHIIGESYILTGDYPNVNAFVNKLSEGIMELIERHGGYDSVHSIGVSCPSGNRLTGCIEMAPNMPWEIPEYSLFK